ncbi:ABC transporter permease [Ethanoligenens harbinense]|uniref:Transport permease protein n=1 Tax=Ethanoligenens harbinense (strain DSM 18485 / JCM 12961 / CGMCC 1.5033 / YUAN-3) TaxID=663278 RepID=E6U4P9_ETHHY|nr:ABC transporter permease [Ethanoligenens harbinense]ADU26677.1 ABC-2 type transporter [Ethanoligenens harbinense YUAN-3]AVQ95794.1 transporter [Ethanoligenens harbinense YUAN-3]AYF38456.1 transporter [Ethanoligenens harbinense]AYF41201.1 transporter [Ethanoligenens harbinense]QCN92034.1 transporter [Ethanoligenens harbinense]
MSAIGAILSRNLLNFSRDKARLFGTLLMSLFFLFVFSFVMKSAVNGLTQPMNYLISGVIIMTVFQASLNNSNDILSDIASGFMKEIMVAPISRVEIAIGQILSSSVIAILQGLLVSVLGLFMGLHLDAAHFLIMIGVMAVAGVTFGSIGLFLATIARNSSAFQIVITIVVMPFTFLSGAYIPTTVMPSFLKPVIYLNPLTYITSIFRYITLKLDGTATAKLVKLGVAFNVHGFIITPVLGFFIIIAIGLVFLALCVYKFSRADFSSVRVAQRHRH